MSWDLLVYNFKGSPPPAEEWEGDEEGVPLGSPASVRKKIDAELAGVDWSDPTHGIYEGDGFTIEFALRDAKKLDSFMIHARGGGDVVAALLKFAMPNGWSLFDLSTDEWIDPADPSNTGWEEFQAFRDRAIAESKKKSGKKKSSKKK